MRRSAWLLLVLAVAALLLWAMRSEDVPPAPASTAPALQPIAARDLVAAEPSATDETRHRAAIETPEALAADSLAFTGRCVDGSGHPFAGCRVEVRPLEALHEARSQDCPEDGTFRIAVRHAGSQYQLRAKGPGCCEVARTFLIESAGTNTATGDVVLPRGCMLSGRVIDASRTPVAAVNVAVFRMSQAVEPFQPEPLSRTRTDAAGRFELRVPGRGQHRFDIAGFDVVSPPVLSIGPDQREAEVELTADRQQFAARIAGRVLDAEGQPVPGALITAASEKNAFLSAAISAGDGSFAVGLRNTILLDLPVTLQAQHDHYEPARSPALAWNTTGVDLVLGTAPRCVLQLSLAGEPVTDATVVLHSREGHVVQGTRLVGPFARGLVPLPPLRSGRCEVVVAPAPATGASLTKVMVQLQGGRPIVIDLPPLLRRTLRVQYHDGAAVPAARFELFTAGAHVAEVTQGIEPQRWAGHSGDAMLLQSGSSDAHGSAVLLGPAGLLTVRVTHPACPVAIAPDVHLDVAQDLVVELQRGGTLRGRVEPPTALAGLRAFAGTTPAAAPAIRLREEGKNRFWPSATSCPIAADGTFELGGIPPGRWQIRLQCTPPPDAGGRIDEPMGLVEFRGSETEQRLLDASELVPAVMTGRITIDGEGRAGTVVQLHVERPGAPARSFSSRTGSNGVFEVRALAGKWTIAAAIGTGVHDAWTQFRWPEPMQLAPGELRTSDFAFARGALLLRCLAPDGAPVAGMQVQVRTPQDSIRAVTPPTDAAGRTRADVDAGHYLLFVLPRSLQQPAALQAWLAARPGKQLADALLALGSFEVSVGPAVERELRMPEAWEQ